MKQHITEPQWNELSEEQQEKFKKTVYDGSYVGPSNCPDCGHCGRPSIGQMIEFLSEHGYNLSIDQMDKAPKPWWRVCYLEMLIDDKDELADGLWEAVKKKL